MREPLIGIPPLSFTWEVSHSEYKINDTDGSRHQPNESNVDPESFVIKRPYFSQETSYSLYLENSLSLRWSATPDQKVLSPTLGVRERLRTDSEDPECNRELQILAPSTYSLVFRDCHTWNPYSHLVLKEKPLYFGEDPRPSSPFDLLHNE